MFPQQDLFLLCCQGNGLYLRINSCRLKWSPPPTARNQRLTPCWMGVLLLLHHCLSNLRVPPAPADSLEGSINASSVILHRRAAHFLASIVLPVLINRRKAWSERVLFMFFVFQSGLQPLGTHTCNVNRTPGLCRWEVRLADLPVNLKPVVYNNFSFSLIICETECSSSCEGHRRRWCVERNAVEILQLKSNLAEKERASVV